MWPAPGYGAAGYMYDVRDVRYAQGGGGSGRRRDREESSASRGRHRRRRRDDDPDDERRDRQHSGRGEKAEKGDKKGKKDKHKDRDKDLKESRRADREDTSAGGRRDGGSNRSRAGSGGSAADMQGRSAAAGEGSRGAATAKANAAAAPVPAPAEESGAEGSEPPQKKSKNWRQELNEEDEDERDLSTDDEGAEKKLAEARRRREALAAKIAKEKADEAAVNEETAGGEAAQDSATKSAGSEARAPGSAAPGDGQGGERETDRKGTRGGSGKASQDAAAGEESGNPKKEVEEEATSMFDDSAEAGKQLRKGFKKHRSSTIGMTGASGDDWDDEEGYYIPKIGEVFEDRYLVVDVCSGKGVFGNVVKAKDQKDPEKKSVAIKIMRANDMMTKNAEREIDVLERLNKTDKVKPQKARSVVRLFSKFAYRRHLCLVFECMADDLRGALKKATKNRGMSLQAVRAYTQQLLIGLSHMHGLGIIHADIKPDNILISKDQQTVKFCDLGTAVEAKDITVSPYLASRFYRAPEIIIGCEFNTAVDTWALGCTLCELFTGKVLLNSKSNNDHLKKIMELKGKIPVRVIRKGAVWKNHFTEELDFKHVVETTPSGENVTKTVTDLTARRSFKDIILERVGPEKRQSTAKEDQDYVKRALHFADLLELMLTLDPEKRIKPDDALAHIFLQDPKRRDGEKAERR